jgi:hypothetical protein
MEELWVMNKPDCNYEEGCSLCLHKQHQLYKWLKEMSTKRYQPSLPILPSVVLIIWPVVNFKENSYIFMPSGISSMVFCFCLCRQIICLSINHGKSWLFLQLRGENIQFFFTVAIFSLGTLPTTMWAGIATRYGPDVPWFESRWG